MGKAVFTYKKCTITHPGSQYKVFDKQGHEIRAARPIRDLSTAKKLIDDCVADSNVMPKVLNLQLWP